MIQNGVINIFKKKWLFHVKNELSVIVSKSAF